MKTAKLHNKTVNLEQLNRESFQHIYEEGKKESCSVLNAELLSVCIWEFLMNLIFIIFIKTAERAEI